MASLLEEAQGEGGQTNALLLFKKTLSGTQYHTDGYHLSVDGVASAVNLLEPYLRASWLFMAGFCRVQAQGVEHVFSDSCLVGLSAAQAGSLA